MLFQNEISDLAAHNYRPNDDRSPKQMEIDLNNLRTEKYRRSIKISGVDPTKPIDILYKLEDIPGIEYLETDWQELVDLREMYAHTLYNYEIIQANTYYVLNCISHGLYERPYIEHLYKAISRDSALWTKKIHQKMRNEFELERKLKFTTDKSLKLSFDKILETVDEYQLENNIQ